MRPAGRGPRAPLLICCFLGLAGLFQISTQGGVIGWLLAGFLLLGARFHFRPRPGELGVVLKCLAALVAFTAILVAALFATWESAEVVVLRYADDRGRPREARLWVIDLEGQPSVATGSRNARVAQLQANPNVELVRGDRAECRRAVVVPKSSATAEARRTAEHAYAEKYGFRIHGSRVLAFFFGAPPGEEPVMIRLDPCPPR